MSFNQILMYVIAAGLAAGGVDKLLGNRFGLGEKFDQGLSTMIPLVTGMAGILCLMPVISGLVGPVASTRKVFKRLGMTINDIDLIEANEAFAAQSLAVAHDLEFDINKVNVNGGAIELGHPVGASGCRILVTLLYEMKKRDAKKGLATLCIGGGMGCTAVVERP